jgi:hypothetical protein
MSKVVAGVYASGVAVSAMFVFGALMTIVSGYVHYSLLGWLSGVAFSGAPLGVLLFAAATMEWRQKDVSGSALAFVIAGTTLMVLTGVFAHVEGPAAALSVLQVITCLCGYFIIKRNKRLVALGG